jgi:hypothetical protein
MDGIMSNLSKEERVKIKEAIFKEFEELELNDYFVDEDEEAIVISNIYFTIFLSKDIVSISFDLITTEENDRILYSRMFLSTLKNLEENIRNKAVYSLRIPDNFMKIFNTETGVIVSTHFFSVRDCTCDECKMKIINDVLNDNKLKKANKKKKK